MSEAAKDGSLAVGAPCGSVHLLGICGVGMAGLAFLLRRRGWRVSGCDQRLNALAGWLRGLEIEVAQGHSAAHLTEVERTVVSTAVPLGEAEVRAARARGVPVLRRGEVLAELVAATRSVAVCGAHGKTTTACFSARLLQELGAALEWCIGGVNRGLGAVAGASCGVDAGVEPLLVVEADESDGTLAWYAPWITVVTNVDRDHLEHFADEAALQACFGRVVAQTRGGVAYCCDNPGACEAAASATVRTLKFGFSAAAELRAVEVVSAASGVSFELLWRGLEFGRIELGVGGRHNVLNALGAVAAVLLLEYEMGEIKMALPVACEELPLRRFECVAEVEGRRFFTDYAHHPNEVRVAVEMAREACAEGNLIVVFQPHRYTRTRALGAEFPAALALADEVIILPVYAASEEALEGGESCDLYAHFREQEARLGVATSARVKLALSLPEVWSYLRERTQPRDLVLIAGAGDVVELAEMIRADIAQGWPRDQAAWDFEAALVQMPGVLAVPYGALGKWSIYGVGGRARWRVEVRGVEALMGVLRLCTEHRVAWQMAGMGANSWYGDLGVVGCVIKFANGTFQEFKAGDSVIEVGCGWCGQQLLQHLQGEGLSGLEFFEAVPGQLGGWLAMNAGAHGREIGERVIWIRCLNPDGKVTILDGNECGFTYRACEALKGRVALACGLRLERATPAAIQTLRDTYRDNRIPLAGLRTAGSLFRNQPGVAAGKLLDAAQCKGLRIGGARVTDFHANIVAIEAGASASDVLALTLKMWGRVKRQARVELVPEVKGLALEE